MIKFYKDENNRLGVGVNDRVVSTRTDLAVEKFKTFDKFKEEGIPQMSDRMVFLLTSVGVGEFGTVEIPEEEAKKLWLENGGEA